MGGVRQEFAATWPGRVDMPDEQHGRGRQGGDSGQGSDAHDWPEAQAPGIGDQAGQCTDEHGNDHTDQQRCWTRTGRGDLGSAPRRSELRLQARLRVARRLQCSVARICTFTDVGSGPLGGLSGDASDMRTPVGSRVVLREQLPRWGRDDTSRGRTGQVDSKAGTRLTPTTILFVLHDHLLRPPVAHPLLTGKPVGNLPVGAAGGAPVVEASEPLRVVAAGRRLQRNLRPGSGCFSVHHVLLPLGWPTARSRRSPR